MKKIGQLILCLVLAVAMVFGVAACGDKEETPGGNTPGGDTPGGNTETPLTQQQIMESVISEMLSNENMTVTIAVTAGELPVPMPIANIKLAKTEKAFDLELVVMEQSQLFFSDGYLYVPEYATVAPDAPAGTVPEFLGYNVTQLVASGIDLSIPTLAQQQISAAAKAVLDTLGKTFTLNLTQDETTKGYTISTKKDFAVQVQGYVDQFYAACEDESIYPMFEAILAQMGLPEDQVMTMSEMLGLYYMDAVDYESLLSVDKLEVELSLTADKDGKFTGLAGSVDFDIKNVPSVDTSGDMPVFDYKPMAGKYGLAISVTSGNTSIAVPTEDLSYDGYNYYYVELPNFDAGEVPPVELKFNTDGSEPSGAWGYTVTGISNTDLIFEEGLEEMLEEESVDNTAKAFKDSDEFYGLVEMYDFVVIEIFDASAVDAYPFATLYVTCDKMTALTQDFTMKFDPTDPGPDVPEVTVMQRYNATVSGEAGSYILSPGYVDGAVAGEVNVYFVKDGQYEVKTLQFNITNFSIALDDDMVEIVDVPAQGDVPATQKNVLKADYIMFKSGSVELLVVNNIDAAVSDGIMELKVQDNPNYDPNDPNETDSPTITTPVVLKTLAEAVALLTPVTPAPAPVAFAVAA